MAKNPAAVELGRRGGKARVKNQTPEERKESARRAAEARWSKVKEVAEELDQRTKALEAKATRNKKQRGR